MICISADDVLYNDDTDMIVSIVLICILMWIVYYNDVNNVVLNTSYNTINVTKSILYGR
jgi:hypothetical protein